MIWIDEVWWRFCSGLKNELEEQCACEVQVLSGPGFGAVRPLVVGGGGAGVGGDRMGHSQSRGDPWSCPGLCLQLPPPLLCSFLCPKLPAGPEPALPFKRSN